MMDTKYAQTQSKNEWDIRMEYEPQHSRKRYGDHKTLLLSCSHNFLSVSCRKAYLSRKSVAPQQSVLYPISSKL